MKRIFSQAITNNIKKTTCSVSAQKVVFLLFHFPLAYLIYQRYFDAFNKFLALTFYRRLVPCFLTNNFNMPLKNLGALIATIVIPTHPPSIYLMLKIITE